MAKAFKLGDYIKPEDVSKSNTERIQYIDLDLIDPDPDNFYLLTGVDDLAENISMVGLLDPLRVRPNGGRYIVESGHRRRAACLLLRDGGSPMFAKGVPCIVTYGEATDSMRRLRLIFANSHTRVLTPPELAKQAEEVTKLLCDLKAQGVELPGRMREHVAEALNVSASKLARVQAIRNNLSPELLAEYDAGRINESVAYRCSQEDTETQKRIWEDQGSVIHNLTADGISAYVAQLRSFDVRNPAAANVEEPEAEEAGAEDDEDGSPRAQGESAQSAERGRPGPSAPTEKTETAFSNGKYTGWDADAYMEERRREDDDFFEMLSFVKMMFFPNLAALNSRQEGIQILTEKFGKTYTGTSNGWSVSAECDPRGLVLYQKDKSKSQIRRTWTEVYDMLCTIALNDVMVRNETKQKFSDFPASNLFWQTGTPPKDGRYFARIDMGDGGVHEAVGAYYSGSWGVFNGPLYEKMRVVGWWPLPEKEA